MKYILFLLTFIGITYAQDVKPVDNQLYKNECASCHFGFQPGLLPQNSWHKVMINLGNHFGTDASLSKEDYNAIYKYIMENSADKAMQYKRSNRIVNSLSYTDKTVDAITKVPYFIKKHREIPKRLIVQDEVKTLSNCAACHTTADKGFYGERAIKIPNYGRWDD